MILLGMSTDEIWARTAGTVLVINTLVTGINTVISRRNKLLIERMEAKAKFDHHQVTQAQSEITKTLHEVKETVEEQNGNGT